MRARLSAWLGLRPPTCDASGTPPALAGIAWPTGAGPSAPGTGGHHVRPTSAVLAETLDLIGDTDCLFAWIDQTGLAYPTWVAPLRRHWAALAVDLTDRAAQFAAIND